MEEGQILGIDLGEKRVGIAMTVPVLNIPQPLKTVGREKVFNELETLLQQYKITRFVVGLPLNMDGTKGEKAKEVEEFGRELEDRFNIPVSFYDERLTTVHAEKIIHEAGKKIKGNKEIVDKISASLILEGYLESKK
jgi:putative Holliday junction resolvase